MEGRVSCYFSPMHANEPPEQIDVPALLSRLPLFSHLSRPQIEQLAGTAKARRLDRGEMLFQKGDPANGFYIVVSGQIKLVFPSRQGSEKVVEVIGPQQSFGEAVMFLHKPYPVRAEAIGNSQLLHIRKEAILSLLGEDASFACRMLAGLSIKLHSLIADVATYSERSSAQRVIGYLLQQCPEGDTDQLRLSLPFSKHVIASRLNLTPETLSRIFHDLSKAGLIAVHGQQIDILQPRQLKDFQA